jgi:selenocysteine lyase/cysteine desulfurase
MVTTSPNPAYAPEALEAAFEAFLAAYPEYESTRKLDELRETEYARLDRLGHIYLDYTGGGVYGESQLRDHIALLSDNVFGNPHSMNPTSLPITQHCERARHYVLEYFNASPDEYFVIFTSNASGALKLVGESYPFDANSQLVQTWDNHNSVNGIREFAKQKGARITFVPLVYPELRVDEPQLFAALDQPATGGHRLFTYPAQSNFSGVQHPLEWIEAAHARGWDVLVDGAAFAPTNRLDLSQHKPDFVPLSFYKMFGYPTGIGCLLVRKEAFRKLRRPWFSGGTVVAVSIQAGWHYLVESGEAFEDGTINYLGIPAVEIGLRHLAGIGIDTIHTRVMCLAGWLLNGLSSLRHSNGKPMAEIYGPLDTTMRGGTVAFNLLDPNGHVVDERLVETRATDQHISIRAGCFCNPGASEAALHIRKDLLEAVAPGRLAGAITFDNIMHGVGLESSGAIRASVGLATNFADVYRFFQFIQTFRDEVPDISGLAPRSHC